jgi:hypothetical protein
MWDSAVHLTFSMALRIRAIFALFVLAAASIAYSEQRESENAQLLPRAEGFVLADRVLDFPTAIPWPDCSHLVHEALNDAGLEYPYATSNELYDGVPHFQRVRHPQAGDLIVWRGHVGVVTDTANHRFFSSTESGPRTDNYESDYWRRRGIPRFYRYVLTDESQLSALASRKAPAKRVSDEPVVAESGGSLEEANAASNAVADTHAPESLPIETRKSKPSKSDVERALNGYLSSGEAPASNSGADVVVVKRAQVKKVHVKDRLGWAEIRFESISEGTKRPKPHTVRWSLRQDPAGWQLVLPQDAFYIAER